MAKFVFVLLLRVISIWKVEKRASDRALSASKPFTFSYQLQNAWSGLKLAKFQLKVLVAAESAP